MDPKNIIEIKFTKSSSYFTCDEILKRTGKTLTGDK
jgi:hypothetical protein